MGGGVGGGGANGERYGVRCVPKMEGEGREEEGGKIIDHRTGDS